MLTVESYAGGNKEFEAWLRQANDALEDLCGLDMFSVADYCWRDAFDDGTPASEAAEDALRFDMGDMADFLLNF